MSPSRSFTRACLILPILAGVLNAQSLEANADGAATITVNYAGDTVNTAANWHGSIVTADASSTVLSLHCSVVDVGGNNENWCGVFNEFEATQALTIMAAKQEYEVAYNYSAVFSKPDSPDPGHVTGSMTRTFFPDTWTRTVEIDSTVVCETHTPTAAVTTTAKTASGAMESLETLVLSADEAYAVCTSYGSLMDLQIEGPTTTLTITDGPLFTGSAAKHPWVVTALDDRAVPITVTAGFDKVEGQSGAGRAGVSAVLMGVSMGLVWALL